MKKKNIITAGLVLLLLSSCKGNTGNLTDALSSGLSPVYAKGSYSYTLNENKADERRFNYPIKADSYPTLEKFPERFNKRDFNFVYFGEYNGYDFFSLTKIFGLPYSSVSLGDFQFCYDIPLQDYVLFATRHSDEKIDLTNEEIMKGTCFVPADDKPYFIPASELYMKGIISDKDVLRMYLQFRTLKQPIASAPDPLTTYISPAARGNIRSVYRNHVPYYVTHLEKGSYDLRNYDVKQTVYQYTYGEYKNQNGLYEIRISQAPAPYFNQSEHKGVYLGEIEGYSIVAAEAVKKENYDPKYRLFTYATSGRYYFGELKDMEIYAIKEDKLYGLSYLFYSGKFNITDEEMQLIMNAVYAYSLDHGETDYKENAASIYYDAASFYKAHHIDL